MIRTLPNSLLYKALYKTYIIIFYIFLLIPLFIISVLAFNNSDFISLPWQGFTLDWFFADTNNRLGLFADEGLLNSIIVSIKTGILVATISLIIGTAAALLFEREDFKFKGFLYFLALSPLVIPGVVLGISILLAATSAGIYIENNFGIDIGLFRPSFWLVVLGQFSFGATYAMLMVGARLKKFDKSIEEAGLSLRANRLEVIRYLIIPFLYPALLSAFVVVFLISFSNFNTTVFLVGGDITLPIDLYSRIRFSSTPVLNAVSFIIIAFVTLMAILSFIFSKNKK